MRHRQCSCISKSFKALTFSGFSMYPSIRPGDILLLREASVSEVIKGDILCLFRGNQYVVHRTIHVQKESGSVVVITKGDNLTIPDPPMLVTSEKILKLVMIRKGKGLISPGCGKTKALLSKKNLTTGILKARIGRMIRQHFKVPSGKEQPRNS